MVYRDGPSAARFAVCGDGKGPFRPDTLPFDVEENTATTRTATASPSYFRICYRLTRGTWYARLAARQNAVVVRDTIANEDACGNEVARVVLTVGG